MTPAPESRQSVSPRTIRFVHAWLKDQHDGPPLCGTPVPYLGPRPLVEPYEICAVCADLVQGLLR